MPTRFVAAGWRLAFEASAALLPTSLVQRLNPTGQFSLPTLPVNPFPQANSGWLQTSYPVPVAMARLVRYYQTEGCAVDTVNLEIFFTMRAYTTLQPPPQPVQMDVQASFGSPPGTVADCQRGPRLWLGNTLFGLGADNVASTNEHVAPEEGNVGTWAPKGTGVERDENRKSPVENGACRLLFRTAK